MGLMWMMMMMNPVRLQVGHLGVIPHHSPYSAGKILSWVFLLCLKVINELKNQITLGVKAPLADFCHHKPQHLPSPKHLKEGEHFPADPPFHLLEMPKLQAAPNIPAPPRLVTMVAERWQPRQPRLA